MTAYIIDSDGGVDDALALCLAAKHLGERLRGVIAVHGNVGLRQAADNLATTLAVLGRGEIPIVLGAERPLARDPVHAKQVHGADGLGDITGKDRIGDDLPFTCTPARPAYPSVEQALAHWADGPEPLTFICIGPLTNMAMILRDRLLDPAQIARIVVMGGAIERGNITPYAEFNAYCDPDAAAIVFASGLAVDIVPLEPCRKYVLTRDQLDDLTSRTNGLLPAFLWEIHQAYIDFYRTNRQIDGCLPHDSIAVGCAVRPEIFRFRHVRVSVETSDADQLGRTRFEFVERSNVRVCVDLDVAEFEAFLVSTVWGGP
ncbi:MAG: nucleoside hydrolase [Alphaproteobacteria bacterium]|nr:nucleoside hydrolase [Alphaproteobacteria bacterium]